VRRFLRVYAPSTAEHFTAWAGVARATGRRLWAGLRDELSEVQVGDVRAWLLAADEAALASPPAALGLRLLPPGDPFLQAPNRAVLVPDAALRRRVFRPLAGPGVVLLGGVVVGLWRVRSQGRRAEFDVEAFGVVDREALEAEAALVAAVRGSERAIVRMR
jgi:hypothetical protein